MTQPHRFAEYITPGIEISQVWGWIKPPCEADGGGGGGGGGEGEGLEFFRKIFQQAARFSEW